MRHALVALSILMGAIILASAIVLKPTGFDRCVSAIGADVERQAARTAATLDPADVAASAARTCAGVQD